MDLLNPIYRDPKEYNFLSNQISGWYFLLLLQFRVFLQDQMNHAVQQSNLGFDQFSRLPRWYDFYKILLDLLNEFELILILLIQWV